jgi:hypothetical protein
MCKRDYQARDYRNEVSANAIPVSTGIVNAIMARDLRIVGLRDQITCHERGLRRMKAKNIRLRKRVAELEAMLPFHGNFDED